MSSGSSTSLNTSLTDLKDYVPMLTNSNYEVWATSLSIWCFNRGILDHLKGNTPEPFRKVALSAWPYSGTTLGTQAGESIPSGLAISRPMTPTPASTAAASSITSTTRSASAATLNQDEEKKWEKWAARERLTRTAIAFTIERSVYIEYNANKYYAGDIFKALKARYQPDVSVRAAEIERLIHNLYLDVGHTADGLKQHVEAFTIKASELASIGVPLAEQRKCDVFLTSLNAKLNRDLRSSWNITTKTWEELATLVNQEIDTLRVDSVRRTDHQVFQAAIAAAINVGNKQPKKKRTNKKKNGSSPSSTATTPAPTSAPSTAETPKPDNRPFCAYHKSHGHATEHCQVLKAKRALEAKSTAGSASAIAEVNHAASA
jgi:hypothetical protein